MKILNRPMFRYGGPIKEGIMNGIQEPRQGYQQSGMVFPGDAARMMPTGVNTANSAKAFENIFQNNVNDARMGTYPGQKSPPLKPTTLEEKIKPYENAIDKNFAVTDYFEKDMNTTDEKIPQNTRYGVVMVDNPDFGRVKRVDKIKETVTRPESDFLPNSGPIKPGMPGSIEEVIKKKDTVIDTEGNRKKSINNILEKLGYARSQKNALYDALIAGGQRISREGLGKTNLVNDLIADTSTAYDKPEKIRQAAELMQVQQDLKLEGIDRSKDNRGPVQKTVEYFMSKDGGDHSREDALALAKNQAIDAYGIFTEAKAKGTTTEAVDFTASKMADAGRFGEGNVYKNRIDTKYKGSSGLIEFMESGNYNGDGVYTRGGEILLLKDGKVTSLVRFKGTGKTGFFGGEKE